MHQKLRRIFTMGVVLYEFLQLLLAALVSHPAELIVGCRSRGKIEKKRTP